MTNPGWKKACLSLALPSHSQLAPADLTHVASNSAHPTEGWGWRDILPQLRSSDGLQELFFFLDFCLFTDSASKPCNLVNL